MDTKLMFHETRGAAAISLIALMLLIPAACGAPPVLTWETMPLPAMEGTKDRLFLADVQFINGSFYAVGGSVILSSPDGRDWSVRHRGRYGLSGIAHGSGTIVAVGSRPNESSSLVLVSSDGSEWVETELPGTNWLSAVTYGNNRFVAVGNETTIVQSTDGKNWADAKGNLPNLGTLRDVAYGGGLFVATGSTGTIITSHDGISWTKRSCDTRRDLNGITYGEGRFVAVSNDFWFSDVRAFVSRNGISWEAEDTDCSEEDLRAVAHGNGVFIAVGGNYRTGGRGNIDITQFNDKSCAIYSSRNGASWRENRCVPGRQLHGIAFGHNRFVAVGNGIILRSSPVR